MGTEKLRQPLTDEEGYINFLVQDSWVMKITDIGIVFNRKSPIFKTSDDFAKAVINIIENEYGFKLEKK